MRNKSRLFTNIPSLSSDKAWVYFMRRARIQIALAHLLLDSIQGK
jgi:hypothetical protein